MKKQLVTACKQYCLAAGATQGNIAYTQTVGGHCKGDTKTDDINKKKGKNYTIQIGGLRADIYNR